MSQDTGNGKLLARIDERTANMEKKGTERWDLLWERLDDHEDRLRGLETWRNIGAVAYGLGAAFIAWVAGDTQS